MAWLGDFVEDGAVECKFTSRTLATGVPTTLAGTPAVEVYKADGLTQSSAGVSLTVDFDAITGLNHVAIDTSADAFYAVGNDYQVVITQGTVGGVDVTGEVVHEFSIENRFDEVDVAKISGDSTAANNLELQYDTTGLTGDTFPSTQAQISSITNSGSAVHTTAASYTLTTGTQSSGTITSTEELDAVTHQHTDDGGVMELYYEFQIGSGSPSQVTVDEALTGNNDSLGVYGYDWVSTSWKQVGTLTGTVLGAIQTNAYDFTTSMVGTGADLGKVRFRYYAASGLTTATLFVDYLRLAFNQSAGGYSDGIEVDTNESNTNTVPGVDGVKGNPVSTWAAALTLSASTGIKEFRIHNGSSIALSANSDSFSITGMGWTLALGGQSIEGIFVEGASVSGVATATVTQPRFEKCGLGAVTMPPSILRWCGIGAGSGTFTAGSAGQYYIVDCVSMVPGSGSPNFAFSGLGSTTGVNVRRWSGGTTWTVDADCTLSVEVLAGGGQTFTTAGADIELRGIFRSATFANSVGGSTPTIQVVGTTGVITISGTASTATYNLYGVSSSLADTSSGTTVNDYTTSRTNYVGGDYALDTDANGRIRIVDGTNAGEINTNAGAIALVDQVTLCITTTTNTDMITVNDIWDELLTGASHNTTNSAGKHLREASETLVITSGTAQGAGANDNQIQLASGASSTDGAYDPALVVIVGGTGIGQTRLILQYAGSTRMATVDRTWKVNPDATSEYIIVPDAGREHVNEGLAQAGGASTITLNTLASSDDDAYNGQTVFIRSGTGEDQVRIVTAYNGTSKIATIHKAWDVVPDTTTAYSMLPVGVSDVVRMETDTITADAFAANALVAATFAASSLDGKGDWNTVVPDAAGVAPTAVENRQEMDSNSTQLAAIVADTNELQADDVPGLIAALNDPTAIAIADAILTRDVSNVEATEGGHMLYTVILATLESAISSTTWTIKQTDGSTTHQTKTVTVDANADPITGVT